MTDSLTPRWLHYWSVLTVCATVVLMGIGSAVTNFHAGMADRAWPTRPTALLEMTAEQRRNVPLVIEHGHRAAGYAVGCCAIVLAVGLWFFERRRWVCWLGTLALLGICFQGLLGGLRVTENARWGLEFRVFHGSFAPLVLSLLVAVAVLTSRTWLASAQVAPADSARLRRGSLVVLLAVYGQIVLGVLLRHTYHPLAQRAHLLFAFAAAASVLWLVRLAWVDGGRYRTIRLTAVALACLLGLQLVLGVEAWMTQLGPEQMARYSLPQMLPVTYPRVAVRTTHVLGGSLLLSATVCVALFARREAVTAARTPVSGARLEEAA